MTTPKGEFNRNLPELLKIFEEEEINMDRLHEYGRVYGFHNAYGRNIAWNKILSAKKVENFIAGDFEETKRKAAKEPEHKYVHQIHIDVVRSLNTIDVFENLPDHEIERRRNDLEELLQTFFSLFQNYHYYQGFHDIGTVVNHVLGNDAGLKAIQKMSFIYFRDALKYPFEESVTLQLKLILRIVGHFDPWFAEMVSSFYEGIPMFALPWMLTWFSHSLNNMNSILRIFDYLISSPPYSIIYMCAAILMIARKELLKSEELDMIVLQSFFQHLQLPNIELVISTTLEMEKQCDIYKLIFSLEKPFPDQSLLAPAKHSKKIIDKYYQHKDHETSRKGLRPTHSTKALWKRQIVLSLFIGFSLVMSTIVYRRFFSESGIASDIIVPEN